MKIDVDRIAQMPVYPTLFALAFPGLTPEERFTRVNAGLAIAAYERTLLANESPFQKWLQGDASAMTEDEKMEPPCFWQSQLRILPHRSSPQCHGILCPGHE